MRCSATTGARRVYPPLVPSRGFSRETLVAFLLLLSACSGSDADAGGRATTPIEPTRRDSAGVAILEHTGDAFERAPLIVIDSIPVAEIRGSVSDESSDISTLMVDLFLGDGRLVAHEPRRGQVMVFSPDGGERLAFGRRGEGPGEFGFIANIVRTEGDTLLIHDVSNSRIVMASPDTGLVRSVSLLEAIGVGAQSPVGRVGNQFMLYSRFPLREFDTQVEFGLRGILMAMDGTDVRRVFQSHPEPPPAEGSEHGEAAVMESAIASGLSPVFRSLRQVGDRFLMIEGSRWQLALWDTAGTPLSIVTVNRPRVLFTPAIHTHVVNDLLKRIMANTRGNVVDTADLRAELMAAPRLDSLPALQRIDISSNGTIWLTDTQVPGDSGWAITAFAVDGRILGRYTQASGSPPVAFGDDRLAFRTEDDDGIATLTIRRIRFN